MTQWYVKELSKLTNISVKTLHHYDKVGLLKPSVRRPNGYRLYSEKDLLKLQQILALKVFGFELSQIKSLMQEEINIFDHFRAQQKSLEQKILSLQVVSQTLETIISENDQTGSLSWTTILKLIKEYQMTQEIENAWVKKVLNPQELVEYAKFEQNLKTRFTPQEEEAYGQQWDDIVKEVQSNLHKDPTSDYGIQMGKRCMDWTNTVFSQKHANLRTTLWDKGFKGGHTDVPADVVAWLDQATSAYYKQQIHNILDTVGTTSSEQVKKHWDELVTNICGDDPAHERELYKTLLADDNISAAAKTWLKEHQR